MIPDDHAQAAVDAILAMPVSDDANAMLTYLARCERDGRQPNIYDLGWDRHRAELALVELRVRGFIGTPS